MSTSRAFATDARRRPRLGSPWRPRPGAALALAVTAVVSGALTRPAAAYSPVALAGINDRGATVGEMHAFELYGTFDLPSAMRPIVTCSGIEVEAEVLDKPLTGQINVGVVTMPSFSFCTFSVQRLTDGAVSGSLTLIPSPPPIEIKGRNDAGVTGGRRYVELYGVFANPSRLVPRVLCSGLYTGARVEYWSGGQINISLDSAVPAPSCAMALVDQDSGLTSPTYGGLPSPAKMAAGFGGYNWGGVVPTTSDGLSQGQGYLDALGTSATRIVITPKVRTGNPIDNYYDFDLAALNARCPYAVTFLPCAIRWAPYQTAISPPQLKTIILTAYDSTTSGPDGSRYDYVAPLFWTAANRAKVVAEYADLTFALYDTQRNTGKTFVVAAWEGDNQGYCGSFYTYFTDGIDPDTGVKFRLECGDLSSRTAAMGALTQWFSARKAGIARGRARAAQNLITGVTVKDGMEMNIDSLTYSYKVNGITMPTILRDVVPAVKPAYLLYSSYDSQYRGHMEQDLRQIRNSLAAQGLTTQLLIGEMGFPRHGVDGTDVFRTVATAKAVQRVGPKSAILWEAFDTIAGNVKPFGLLQADGTPRRVGAALTRELAAQAAEIQVGTPIQINAAVDRLVTNVGGIDYRYYELYGSFPGSGYSATALCDGIGNPAEVVYESSGQLNVRLLHGTRNRMCTVRVTRADGVRSLEFGPVGECADGATSNVCL